MRNVHKKKSITFLGLRFSHIKWSGTINLGFRVRTNQSGIVLEYGKHSFYFYYKLFKKV